VEQMTIHKEGLTTGVFHMKQSEKEFFSRRDLATMFGVSSKTIINWQSAGLLTAVHLASGSVRYGREEIERFIAAQTAAKPTRRRAKQ
jgi:predicted DNA-binding transcriptional regulator AlpA